MEIIVERIRTVGDLIDGLSKLPRTTTLIPTGDNSMQLAYDPIYNMAYLDNADWIADTMEQRNEN